MFALRARRVVCIQSAVVCPASSTCYMDECHRETRSIPGEAEAAPLGKVAGADSASTVGILRFHARTGTCLGAPTLIGSLLVWNKVLHTTRWYDYGDARGTRYGYDYGQSWGSIQGIDG